MMLKSKPGSKRSEERDAQCLLHCGVLPKACSLGWVGVSSESGRSSDFDQGSDESLSHVAQRSCPNPGRVQDQGGWSLEQPGLVEGTPAHGWEFGTGWSLSFLPIQTVLWSGCPSLLWVGWVWEAREGAQETGAWCFLPYAHFHTVRQKCFVLSTYSGMPLKVVKYKLKPVLLLQKVSR